MRRFGYAIRTGGDPEIGGALAEGIERGTARTSSVSAGGAATFPRGEGLKRHSSEAVRRVAMMRHTPEEWAAMTEEARVIYGGQRYTPRWAEWLLAGVALICMGASWLYHRQDRLLQRRAI